MALQQAEESEAARARAAGMDERSVHRAAQEARQNEELRQVMAISEVMAQAEAASAEEVRWAEEAVHAAEAADAAEAAQAAAEARGQPEARRGDRDSGSLIVGGGNTGGGATGGGATGVRATSEERDADFTERHARIPSSTDEHLRDVIDSAGCSIVSSK